MSPMTIAERLALNKYDVDAEPHIHLKAEVCQKCEQSPCLYICPAECFKLREGKLSFAYEGCLECGSCRISCDKGAIEWSYPRGGFGVSFEYG
jgi:ferredoxin like protein